MSAPGSGEGGPRKEERAWPLPLGPCGGVPPQDSRTDPSLWSLLSFSLIPGQSVTMSYNTRYVCGCTWEQPERILGLPVISQARGLHCQAGSLQSAPEKVRQAGRRESSQAWPLPAPACSCLSRVGHARRCPGLAGKPRRPCLPQAVDLCSRHLC